ncbi:MAG: ABC transporter ATP-binding protein [Zymomonas mobilis subsp. pomaceae]|uniref:ABC transporter related protein n=1 Tax=Zymomonas mobilis subsp. pomaceae (strain ATCC 29192 / DSM 22645 / JCM 10191 / CCUG 17912 / NBRC 13757 / NCIMB 11200 / NRRL B-4491 / Barker I) TaxID=579138 RepID=F8EU74_ZYMMT|nr:ABC transporter ATP-binding protein [Zymomonas mobilis]AEI37154.1 ABC transporter related protein [Zymomonas mobilis subsp. pomaceae ATCC 29192]MDX5948524.1 ABC transporter ATP-binding protein [Zymomonas mobilis subsp. pomaceae]GEB89832.1 bacitracin ABC transporter ATP-binding protein [Zymomonas mobilis subsp. pomaceae]
MTTAIRLHNVSKNFGAHTVLKDINLTVPKNSLFAFLGNNGQGKSTTIRLITGLCHATSGKVVVLGHDMQKNPIAALQNMGCLVDSPSLYGHMTAFNFLKIGCLLKKLPYQEIDRVIEMVSLHCERNLKISHYSLGMKQRLALAHALLGNPKLLILDEPTNGLDPEGIKEIRELLVSLPERTGCTVFFSSHQLEEVEKTATHLALLSQGEILFQGTLESIRATHRCGLLLEVADNEAALTLLTNHGYKVFQHNENKLLIEGIYRQDTPPIYRLLVEANIDFYQSTLQQPKLEQWFSQQIQLSRGGV